MNETEHRTFLRQMGLPRPYRGALPADTADVVFPTDVTPSAQTVLRAKTERFVQANWSILRETLTCSGNCSQADNPCTDAQALVCYRTNQRAVDMS